MTTYLFLFFILAKSEPSYSRLILFQILILFPFLPHCACTSIILIQEACQIVDITGGPRLPAHTLHKPSCVPANRSPYAYRVLFKRPLFSNRNYTFMTHSFSERPTHSLSLFLSSICKQVKQEPVCGMKNL